MASDFFFKSLQYYSDSQNSQPECPNRILKNLLSTNEMNKSKDSTLQNLPL